MILTVLCTVVAGLWLALMGAGLTVVIMEDKDIYMIKVALVTAALGALHSWLLITLCSIARKAL